LGRFEEVILFEKKEVKMKFRVIIMALFCFVLTVSVFAMDYDFADPKATATNAKDWKVIKGTWILKDGMYSETELGGGNDGNAFSSIYQSKWVIGDGTVIMKAKHDAKSTGTNDAILLYRMVDDKNGYASRLQRDGYLTIGKITSGVYTHLKYTATPVEADKVYTVTVKLKGNAIEAYLNDNLLVSVNDKTFDKGQIGLCIGRSAFPIHFLFVSADGTGIPKGSAFIAVESPGKLTATWGYLKK
jgi:hypothetical protein